MSLRLQQLIVGLAIATAAASACSDPKPVASCAASDDTLRSQRSTICSSYSDVGKACCGFNCSAVSAKGDWPNQAVYVTRLLQTLTAPGTCLNTTFARATVAWLNSSGAEADPGTFFNTWTVFQVQYYDMPRKPGSRIEAPDTLGRKCWAFAFLRLMWNPSRLQAALRAAGLALPTFVSSYEAAVPLTMELCEKVKANCFVNASYNQQRNGTCPTKVFEFHDLGFERENLLRDGCVPYPFTR